MDSRVVNAFESEIRGIEPPRRQDRQENAEKRRSQKTR
jgi:hypothetical protein